MLKFYKFFDDIKDQKFDGLVVTGAPVELLDFEEVDYWEELCEILEWSKSNVYSTFHICWGAQAGLYYHYGLPKYKLDEKIFGVFPHRSLDSLHPLMRGFNDEFQVPHSRYTEIRRGDIAKVKDLQILSYSDIAGVHIVSDMACRKFFVTGIQNMHETLCQRYFRDIKRDCPLSCPKLFSNNDSPQNIMNGESGKPPFSKC